MNNVMLEYTECSECGYRKWCRRDGRTTYVCRACELQRRNKDADKA